MLSEIRAKLRTKRGFTLMEILIVIAIIAVLSVAFLPNALSAPKKARDAGRIKKIQDIQTAVEAFAAEKGEPPASVENGDCLDAATATKMSITLPSDSSKLGSCTGDNKDLYLYKYDGTNRIYIIGVKLEVNTSANTKGGNDPVDTPGELTDAIAVADATVTSVRTALIETDINAATKGKYFVAIGPV